MKGKKTIFIGVTGILIAVVVLIVIALLSQLSSSPNSNTNSTVSSPVSTAVNIIDFNNSKGGAFEYAVIRPDDTIELRNKLNEKFIIGLEKKSWKNIKWSPDGKLVAALGKSTGSIYDIYIYSIAQKQWSQASDFKNFTTGVDQYSWVDGNTILFTQGEIPNRWLHRFNYVSKETLKVANIIGDITKVSSDLKYLVVKSPTTVPEIYDATGTKLHSFDNMKDADTQSAIAFNEINFFNNSEKILALDVYGNYYKFNLGETAVVKTSLTSDYKVVCSLTDNSFNGFIITSNSLSYGSFSSKDDLFNILGEEAFKLSFTIDQSVSYCANGSVYLKLQFADGSTQWYKEDATKIEADGVLDGNKETDIIRK